MANTEAVLELARVNYERIAQLAKDKAVSKSELDQARAEMQQARAQLKAQQAAQRPVDAGLRDGPADFERSLCIASHPGIFYLELNRQLETAVLYRCRDDDGVSAVGSSVLWITQPTVRPWTRTENTTTQ